MTSARHHSPCMCSRCSRLRMVGFHGLCSCSAGLSVGSHSKPPPVKAVEEGLRVHDLHALRSSESMGPSDLGICSQLPAELMPRSERPLRNSDMVSRRSLSASIPSKTFQRMRMAQNAGELHSYHVHECVRPVAESQRQVASEGPTLQTLLK